MKILTIVIAVFNRCRLIERTLDSMSDGNNCHDRFRIIVVDNGSTDSTKEVVARWIDRHPDIDTTLTEESRRGAAAARNAGLRLVDTDYVMFFDSDDIVLSGFIDRLVNRLESEPMTDIIGWDIDMEKSDGSHRRCRFSNGNYIKNHLIHAILATQCFAASTRLVKEAGGWDETLPAWKDYELGARLLLDAKS
ncbi:MAG: glycosyltransferase family 2 protein, partial [Muribaculaceae bacterium]|nr:glycosyltransferase family 2 protein [Muribaculaceae bacterium]